MVNKLQSIQLPGLAPLDPNLSPARAAPKSGEGKDFKSLLMDSVNEVNQLQSQADKARIDLATGETDNVAEVFTAIKKAEMAFQTLMQIRNKLTDAYDEIKQMRV
jgi:flagellar hook-basal body complex protein FliE